MKHVDPSAALLSQAHELGVELSQQAAASLLGYEDLLRDRASGVGGVSTRDLEDPERLRLRHILDCLRAVRAISDQDRDAYDLGSGVGLPGIVVALARPSLSVRLVEPRRRRVAFVELAIERLRLANVEVLARRAETLTEPADLCFARALAPPDRAWALAEPRLRPTGRLVYFAGAEGAPSPDEPGAPAQRLLAPEGPLLESAGPLVIMARE